MRCFIGFFGITRSLRHTATSIHQRIYEPLHRAGIRSVRAGHFNLPRLIDNPRSGELGLTPDRTESILLQLDLCWTEPQDQAAVAAEVATGSLWPDRFGDGYRSLANLCWQLRSLWQLWSMLPLLGLGEEDVILFLRPDLVYIDALDPLVDLAPVLDGRADMIVPSWQCWGGFNDRFAFCNRRGAEAYATRIRHFAEGCAAMNGMHSESYLRYVASRAQLRVGHTDLRAARLRANGSIAHNDLALLQDLKPAQDSAA